MKNDCVSVIVCRIGQPARVEEMPATLEALQSFVGGNFEGWGLSGGLFLICHGEGMLIGLPINRVHARLGCVHGDFVVTRVGRTGDTISVRETDLERVEKMFEPIPQFVFH